MSIWTEEGALIAFVRMSVGKSRSRAKTETPQLVGWISVLICNSFNDKTDTVFERSIITFL